MYRSKRLSNLIFPTLAVFFLSVFSFGGVVHAQGVENARPLSVNEQIIQQQSQENAQKAEALLKTSQETQTLAEQKQALTDKLAAEQAKIEELKQKVAAKKAEAAAKVVVASAPPVFSGGGGSGGQGPMSGCGDNQYAAYIYGQESGGRVTGNCNPSSVNAGGCRGIGQACPGGKLPCGADYACQNEWFTGYALRTYGSWAAAYNFHKANGWW